MPPVQNAPELRSLNEAVLPVQSEYPAERRAESISSVSFVRLESNFLQYTGDTDAKKWWTRILKFEFCDFFRNFQKGVVQSLCSRSGPLWSRSN